IAGAPPPRPGFGGGKKRRDERARESAPAAVAAREAVVDVRGLRAEDAVREVELFLDRSYSEGLSEGRGVHGHGTAALKKPLGEALSESPYVSGIRPGASHEGGDGTTVVALRT